jgi:hypothetical protein
MVAFREWVSVWVRAMDLQLDPREIVAASQSTHDTVDSERVTLVVLVDEYALVQDEIA